MLLSFPRRRVTGVSQADTDAGLRLVGAPLSQDGVEVSVRRTSHRVPTTSSHGDSGPADVRRQREESRAITGAPSSRRPMRASATPRCRVRSARHCSYGAAVPKLACPVATTSIHHSANAGDTRRAVRSGMCTHLLSQGLHLPPRAKTYALGGRVPPAYPFSRSRGVNSGHSSHLPPSTRSSD